MRSWSARALAQIGPQAKPALRALTAALMDENEDVRLWAEKALTALNAEKATSKKKTQ